MIDRTPAIVGIGLSDAPKAPHLSAVGHHAQALRRALDDCGLDKSAIDGFACAGMGTASEAAEVAEYLGVQHRWFDTTMTGGSAFEFHLQHAADAVSSGRCEVALITYGSDYLTRLGRSLGTSGKAAGAPVSGAAMFHDPYGLPLVGAYAMVARRHMHEFGTTPEQLAEVAVGVREFASLNPNALYREPLTVDDVLDSRMISDPLHKLDCCVVSDGGGAVLLTTAERAADLARPPVHVLAVEGAQSHWTISQMPDFTTSSATQFRDRLFAAAGVAPTDIDVLQFYDSFTITVLVLLEDLGLCPKGEAGAWVADGNVRRGGTFPMNTDGGGLSASHSGMRGIFLIIEAVRQLRGDAGPAQVPGAEVALVAGSGGWLSMVGAAILSTRTG